MGCLELKEYWMNARIVLYQASVHSIASSAMNKEFQYWKNTLNLVHRSIKYLAMIRFSLDIAVLTPLCTNSSIHINKHV